MFQSKRPLLTADRGSAKRSLHVAPEIAFVAPPPSLRRRFQSAKRLQDTGVHQVLDTRLVGKMRPGCGGFWCCVGTVLLGFLVLGFSMAMVGAFGFVDCNTEVLAKVDSEQHILQQTTDPDSEWPWLRQADLSFPFEGISYSKNLSTVYDQKSERGLWRTPDSMAVCFTASPATSTCHLSDGENVKYQSREDYLRWRTAVIVFGSVLGAYILALVLLAVLASQRCKRCAACLPLWTKQPIAEMKRIRNQHQTIQPTMEKEEVEKCATKTTWPLMCIAEIMLTYRQQQEGGFNVTKLGQYV